MRHKVAEGKQEPIYLGPPHEQLLTHLRQVRSSNWSSSFSWLGYGSIMSRKEAGLFLNAMKSLEFETDERAMADNYFSVLRNVVPETWFDHNNNLGGGEPFTVGAAGDERNNVHIVGTIANALNTARPAHPLTQLRATEYLSMLFPCEGSSCSSHRKETDPVAPEFVRRSANLERDRKAIYKAACLKSACVLETSIQLFQRAETRMASRPTDMLIAEQGNPHWFREKRLPFHLDHPLSNAVDGLSNTAFRSEGEVFRPTPLRSAETHGSSSTQTLGRGISSLLTFFVEWTTLQ